MMAASNEAIPGTLSGSAFLVGFVLMMLGLGGFVLYALRRYKKSVPSYTAAS